MKLLEPYVGKEINTISKYNYIKSHDFSAIPQASDFNTRREKDLGISESINPDFKYLIQFRHPIPALQSLWEFQVGHNNVEDTAERFSEWLNNQLLYWKSFMEKWVLIRNAEQQSSQYLYVEYDRFISNQDEKLREIIGFITDSASYDSNRMNEVLQERARIRLSLLPSSGGEDFVKRKISDFKYFDKEQVLEIENSITEKYLAPAKIKLLDWG